MGEVCSKFLSADGAEAGANAIERMIEAGRRLSEWAVDERWMSR